MSDKPSVVEALSAVMEEVRAVKKGDRNTQQNYNFRGVDAVVNACAAAVRKHGVIIMPMTESANWRDVQTSTGKASRECTVSVRYRFYGPAGDYIDAVVPGESMDFGDKGAPKAMSVAYRTALIQALCLPTDEVDPDHATYERAATTPAPRNGQQTRATPQNGNGEATEPTGADAARAKLRKEAGTSGWDLSVIAARFEDEQGVTLREATNADVIERFRQGLYAIPKENLVTAS
jgi:hypothetical protein